MKAKELPLAGVSDVKSWAKQKLDEFSEVSRTTDPDIIEAYSNFNKQTLKRLIAFLEQTLKDSDIFGQFKKANRKPRAKKEKPPLVQVKGLKYKTKDDELKITSVTVTDILGASQVWVYNTKTRKLAVYRSDATNGIRVKGSTLQNYDVETSIQKTLRKPEEQLAELRGSGKVQLRKFMDNIKAKSQPVTGRINSDTLIIRVVQ
jgi:hypothetical protein